MRLFVLGNAHRPGVQEEAERLLPFLQEHAEVVAFDLLGEKVLSTLTADVALVLGGDGAILRAARQMGYRQTPVLGINLGKLGFLADLSPDQLRQAFPQVVRGEYHVTRHLMFECVVEEVRSAECGARSEESGEVKADGTATDAPSTPRSALSAPHSSRTVLGLNEITVRSAPPFHMVELDVLVGEEAVARVAGDGLIVSTPVGSTGHSLSAGGPVLGQELDAFVLTPICPHTLTYRPLVGPADKAYTVVVRRARPDATLIIDGQESFSLSERHRVTVRRAPVNFGLVKVPGHSYYQTLRDKLRWGTGPNYRSEP